MPISGEKLDELLSGLVDDHLSSQESEQVRRELEEQPAARARLEELKQTRRLLQQHFENSRVAAPALPADFAERIVRRAEVARAAGQDSTIDRRDSASQSELPPQWRKMSLAIAVLAATVLIAVSIPRFFETEELSEGDESLVASSPADDSQDAAIAGEPRRESSPGLPGDGIPNNPFGGQESSIAEKPTGDPVDENSDTEQSVEYVSQLGFGLRYLLVVDIQMTKAAAQQDVLKRILRQAGIDPNAPIVGNEDVEQAIAESRMSVSEQEQEATEASIYFLRAAIDDLGQALDRIYLDGQNFPNVALDLAWDDANVRLIETIAKGTGTRFSINQKFVAPITLDASTSSTPAFSGIEPPTRYVSSQEREQGFGELPAMQAGPDGSSLETMLLFVRVVDE